MCECGGNVYIKKTQECKRCYYARYRAENWQRVRDCDNKRYVPKPIVYTAAAPPTGPCSYDAAHQRVRYYRGRPTQHTCQCGAQATEWSYRNNDSAYEMSGPRRKLYRSGEWETVTSTWSTHIKDYDALCHACHVFRDRWLPRLTTVNGFFEIASETPAAALQLLSPEAASDDR